jgi:hypothetical protein
VWFVYGKKMAQDRTMVLGLILMIFPYLLVSGKSGVLRDRRGVDKRVVCLERLKKG